MAEQLLEKDRQREILAAEVAKHFCRFRAFFHEFFQVAQRTSKRKESKSKIRDLTVSRSFSPTLRT